MKLLENKNAIITGSKRGIGRVTVEVFAKHGANIWACARRQDDDFEKDMQGIAEKYGIEIWPVYFDVTNEEEVKQAIQTIRKYKKDVDILANIAGIVGEKTSFPMSSMDSMRTVMDTNFFAVTAITQYVIRLMIRRNKGSIIYVSSIAGLDGTPSQYGYAASKSALIGAMKNLSREVAGNNIRVNVVAPGLIDTDMGAEIGDNLKNEMLSKVIMKRMGNSEEVANVIAFLGSDLSSYMTAQVVRVDGGYNVVDNNISQKCREAANCIRRDIIDMTFATGNMGAHLGGSLSMAEMLSALYVGCLKYDKNDANWEERDRVILSKGHAALALYPAMVQAGIIDRAYLNDFKKNGSLLSGHPSLNGLPGIEFASGSLGQGLSLGVGVCLALKRKENSSSKVFVFMGDGEVDEGSVWEAAASASHYCLTNLIAVIDMNKIQYDGETESVLAMSPMSDKWKAFGWNVLEIDGHDVNALLDSYSVKSNRPLVILANTVKGKGISFMENNWRFHNSRLSQEQYEQAMRELEVLVCCK